ncbi:hypothetical protein [Endozoicomonas sp. ONNA1]|uniref:hypothetical protein n=1 Tax=Endozoicomonas sp. ONNA1 TaxID=2828740 RepID=UPI002148BF26|nr:hypothetical protein [Endozoicomonas sp. ONNA1]
MALSNNKPIKLSEIAAEFKNKGNGGSTPYSLTDYYGAATGVPASGELSITDFLGKSSIVELTLGSSQNVNIVRFMRDNGVNSGIVRITITGTIGADSINAYALTINNLSNYERIEIIISAGVHIVGKGGTGGDGGGERSFDAPTAGGLGGNAMLVDSTANGKLVIDNRGVIAGGGGGGGGGSFYNGIRASQSRGGHGGGGGAGFSVGTGGYNHDVTQGVRGTFGHSGTLTTGGAGRAAQSNSNNRTYSGKGGNLGQPGSRGYAHMGGSAGIAVVGNSYVQWTLLGTIAGSRV